VEACDLKEGDELKKKSGEGLIITSLLSRYENTEVYNINVEGYHNYAVHQKGILVHNKMGEPPSVAAIESLITVYGTVTLEHYKVSILGAAAASALLAWLQENGYQVNSAAEEVLDTYIDRNLAFVAVKLNPSEKRHYENEFLSPLTIKYQSDRLIFPLRISSVSTTQTAKITLYVIAESTVTSSNFPTMTLKYEDHLTEWVDPEKYIETCIQRTIGSEVRRLVVMWSGEFAQSADEQKIIDELMKVPFPEGKMRYLTRLETRMDPTAMTDDIRFPLDRLPNEFRVRILADAGWGSELILAARDGETETVQKQQEAGAAVNARDEDGWTALMSAAWGGRVEIVQILLQAGVDVNDENNDGKSALMLAKEKGHTPIVNLLRKAGAKE